MYRTHGGANCKTPSPSLGVRFRKKTLRNIGFRLPWPGPRRNYPHGECPQLPSMSRRTPCPGAKHPENGVRLVQPYKGGMGLAWLSVVLLALSLPAVCAAANAVPAEATQCVLEQQASLDVAWDGPDNKPLYPLVTLALNDQPASFLFQANSFWSVAKAEVAEQLKLPVRLFAPNVSLRKYIVVPKVTLGHLVLKDVTVGLVSNKSLFGEKGVGALAMGSLTAVDIELDLRHDKINLFSSHRCDTDPVYWADTYAVARMHRGKLNDLYFDMELEGKKLQTELGTTEADSKIWSAISKRLFGFDDASPDLDPSHHYRAMALTANGLRVANARISVLKSTKCVKDSTLRLDEEGALGFGQCYGAYPLILGLSVLRDLRIYIATKENKMYFTAWDAHRSGQTN